ncbi:MAG: type II toxin-antitoxin system mRNA interferase toxin, RelE/StbE family [Verrucomicrobiales bacterium]|nr:type II toxin-antitoxin system mRNA interferase toxin, RelE/StbE family [Verrucomicrobiales bacterium]|tara:strand:+ start:547 stop:819 length:273 start_codon:yes stop_codon:yes gene_type:complete
MFTPVYTRQFEKDLKRCLRRGKDPEKFKTIARTLLAGESLDALHRDHKLIGNYTGRRECHIESDWLLIYKIDEAQLTLERTGTHSDLFKK